MKRLFFVFFICILLTGCTARHKTQQTLFAMDTVMDLQVWAQDAKTAQNALGAVQELIGEIEGIWSATDETSVLSALNRGEACLSPEQKALLGELEALSERTGGTFDPKLHGVIESWGFLSGQCRVPSREELDAALEQKKWNLGAAMKGYAGQKAAELLDEMNVDRAILNLGGNIQTYGSKPDGQPWQIGIQNPEGKGNMGIISVEGTIAVVTSGDYQRFFEENGKKYHHILDPETGYPVESGLKSVTVICRDGLTADVLSTALFVMGLADAAEFWRESDDFEAVFVLSDGQVLATEGAQLSGCVYEVIRREE